MVRWWGWLEGVHAETGGSRVLSSWDSSILGPQCSLLDSFHLAGKRGKREGAQITRMFWGSVLKTGQHSIMQSANHKRRWEYKSVVGQEEMKGRGRHMAYLPWHRRSSESVPYARLCSWTDLCYPHKSPLTTKSGSGQWGWKGWGGPRIHVAELGGHCAGKEGTS